MIRATRRHRSVALGLAAFLALSALPAREAHARIACSDLSDLTTLFFQKHLRFHTLSPELRTRAAQNFIRRFDPQRVLFLESDIERLEDQLVESFSETRSGNCRPLSDIHQEVVGRSREVEGFVRGYVGGDDYELDSEVELILDSDKRGHPANTAERDELLRSLAHFQISNYLSNDASLDEARERLIHRYELLSKRVAELSRDDVYAAFLDSFGNALDPHSSYLSTEVFEDFKIQMELSLEGIGVALSERDGYSVVEQIIPGGAADQLDVLKPQDRIIAVAEDGGEAVDIIDMALRDVVRLIRGKKGTRVHLTVLRQEDTTERFHVSIVRDKIDLEESGAELEIREVEVDGEHASSSACSSCPRSTATATGIRPSARARATCGASWPRPRRTGSTASSSICRATAAACSTTLCEISGLLHPQGRHRRRARHRGPRVRPRRPGPEHRITRARS